MDYAYNLAHTWIILIRTLWGGILILHDLRHGSTLQPVSYCIVIMDSACFTFKMSHLINNTLRSIRCFREIIIFQNIKFFDISKIF